jgi:homotetrameric cytidine deaminase
MTFRRDRVAAFAMNRPFTPEELLLAARLSGRPLKAVGEGFLVDESVPFPKPAPAPLLPLIEGKSVGTPREGIELAQALTEHAFVPESDFPVGCILETTSGKLIPGVNVENADWSRILCAERNALGTAWTYGFNNIKNLYLTCTKDSQCSPCGACRQLLAELTPAATLWMDRGSDPEQHSTPELLLPASFTGQALFNHS